MECEKVSKLTDDYVFGLLSEEEKRALERHIQSCGLCKRSVEDAESFHTKLSEWRGIQPRDGFAEMVARKVLHATYLPFVRTCQLITAAASILIAIILFLQPSPATSQKAVLGLTPRIETRTGILNETAKIEIEFPRTANSQSLYILLRILPQKREPFLIHVEVNGNTIGDFFCPAEPNHAEFAYLIGNEAKLRKGENVLVLKKAQSTPVKYELISGCEIEAQ